MAEARDELRDVWSREDGKMVRRGDSATINDWLAHKLVKVRTDPTGWVTLYRHRDTGLLWELSYPQGEMYGGGPRRLRCLGNGPATADVNNSLEAP
jgi:hypothetical protein